MVTMEGYFAFTALSLVLIGGLTSAEVEINCVPLGDCPELENLVNRKPISPKLVQLLRSSFCGSHENDRRFWCTQVVSSCRTPNNRLGKCIPAKKCQPFIDVATTSSKLPAETKNFLQRFECEDPNKGTHSFSVCCPVDKGPIIIPPTLSRPRILPRPSGGECGQQVVTKIIGGKATEMNEFPWTVLLEYTSATKVVTGCGGSLISNRYVVTAAHCVDNLAMRGTGKLTNVILGEFDTRTDTDCINSLGIKDCADAPVKIPVQEVIVHPQWLTRLPALINHDIALLRLAAEVTFTEFIKPICLPSPTLSVKEKERLIVAGWGQTEKGKASFVKLKTDIPVANRDACVEKYLNDKRIVVGDGELCAGGEEGKDSCSGDSGGPLMLSVDRSGTSVWFLAGVVSFGPNQPCGQKGYPALYTYIPKYIDWIYKTIES